MKGTLKNTKLRSVVALLVAFCMILGMAPIAALADDLITSQLGSGQNENKTINYVSLGDSMTNGYGLDGYTAEAGVYDYGYYSYANQFAAALAGLTTEEFNALAVNAEQGFGTSFTKGDVTVNHAQLGLSAARPEDVNFLLRLDYDDPAVVDLLDKYPTDDKVYWNCGNHSGVNYEEIVYCAQCKWDHVDLPGYGVWDGSHSVDDYPAWWTLVHGENWQNLIGAGDFWTWKELTEDYRFGTVATYIKSIYGTDAEKARAAELMASKAAKPRDDGSNGEETVYVAKHYQEQIKNADVISLGIGNGNFGVWLMGRITTALMDYDGVGYNGAYNVEDALSKLDPELQAKAEEILEEIEPYVDQYVTTMMGDNLDADVKKSIQDVCTYAVVSFMVNYKEMVERILELNPDVEIVMLGLMNTYAGDDAMADEGQVTIGNILDVMFPPLSAFIAGLPTYMQSIDENDLYKDAKFYYAEEYEIECLIQNFGDDSFYAWEGVARDRFVVGIVGECDCGNGCTVATACGDWDYGIFWELLDGFNMGGITIQRINQKDIKDYEALDAVGKVKFAASDKDKAGSIAVYLAIEDAICKSGRLAPVTLSTLTGLELGNPAILGKALGNFTTEQEKIIADYYADATAGLEALGVDYDQTDINDMSMILSLPVALSNALWTDSDLCSMLAVVARNKLGNGLGAHPSVAGHAALAEVMIDAYENEFTAADKTMENIIYYVSEYYDEIYAYVHNSKEYQEATTGRYRVDSDSYYVALGDGTVLSDSYVDLLANELGVTYKNLAKEGLQADGLMEIVTGNLSDINKADLITIGFSNSTFLTTAMTQILSNQLDTEYDWVKYLGEEGAAQVKQTLADLKASFIESGMDGKPFINDLPSTLTVAVEAYAYSFVSYLYELPAAINEIKAVNPDALIIIVGMYNPMKGVTFNLGSATMDISEYVDYLVDAAGLHGIGYAMTADNTIYVSAPEVTSTLTDTELDVLDLMNEFFQQKGANLAPSADGHEYIKNQILNSLILSEGMLGDADSDGDVDNIDSMLILQYFTEEITADELDLSVCDVDGNGAINNIDSMLVLQHFTEEISEFPVS